MSITSCPTRTATGLIIEAGIPQPQFNAIKHGLTASLPVTGEDHAAMERAIAEWSREIGPVGFPEEALVRQAAAASIRLERCQNAEQNALESNVREALQRWEKKARHAIRRTAQRLTDDPAGTVERLEQSAFGCDWMIRHWEALDATLNRGRTWSRDQFVMAAQLTGHDPREVPVPSDDPAWQRFWRLAHHAAPDAVPPLPYPAAPGESVPIMAAEIRAQLRQIVAAHRARLEARRDEAWDEVEGPAQEAVRANGLIDISKEGQPRRRYEREASLALNRSLSMLLRLRAARTKDEDRAAGGSTAGIIPKQYLGDGWWKQADAAPAPPGYQVIPKFPSSAGAASSPSIPKSGRGTDSPAPEAPAAPLAHQRRNERRAAALDGLIDFQNSFDLNEIRIIADPLPPADSQRTEPRNPAPLGSQSA